MSTLNGLRALSVRLFTPWRGPWFADVDLDPEDVALAPKSGLATIRIGESVTLVGKVDMKASGSFVASARVRVVGGLGWSSTTPRQHFHQPGLFSTQVLAATAATVGEVIVDEVPLALGDDYVRGEGPASRVFGARDWYVDATGVTHTGLRPPAIADPSLELLDFDPLTHRADIACEALVLPGTTLVGDTRLNGEALTLRDVEQTWDGKGVRVVVWCSASPATRLGAALRALARESVQPQYMRTRRYRFVLDVGGGLALQAVNKSAGLPDLNLATVWSGLAGATTVLKPGTEVFVEFVDGDPSQPVILGVATAPIPLQTTIDASARVTIGPSAPTIELGAAPEPLAHAAAVVVAFQAISAALAVVSTTIQAMSTGYGALTSPQQTAFTSSMAAIGVALGAPVATLVPCTVVKGT